MAIIDSGVEWHYPDLQTNSTPYGCNTGDKLNSTRFGLRPNINGGEPSDYMKNYNWVTAQECGHGTCVASILSAGLNNDSRHMPGFWDGYDVAGIAPLCRYFPIAVKCKYIVDQQGSHFGGPFMSAAINALTVVGSVKRIYDCNRTLLGLGAPYYNIEIVNCNVTTNVWNSSLYQEVCNLNPYVNIISPSGNDPRCDRSEYPGAFYWQTGVMSIGGYSEIGQVLGNYSTDITVFAPSVNFPALDLVGVNQRGEQLGFVSDTQGNVNLAVSGTCYATPHVSGVAALLVSNNPILTPQQVKACIRQHATPLPPDPTHNDLVFLHLDAYRALSGT